MTITPPKHPLRRRGSGTSATDFTTSSRNKSDVEEAEAGGNRSFGNLGNRRSGDASVANTGQFAGITSFREQEKAARDAEMRALERMAGIVGDEAGLIQGERSEFSRALRSNAAAALAQSAGRRAHQGLGGGGAFGLGSQAMSIADRQRAASASFGERERAARRDAARARVELEQKRLAGITKPGKDVDFVTAEADKILERYSADWTNYMSGGYYGKKPNPAAARAELEALKATTDDPLAHRAIDEILDDLDEQLD